MAEFKSGDTFCVGDGAVFHVFWASKSDPPQNVITHIFGACTYSWRRSDVPRLPRAP